MPRKKASPTTTAPVEQKVKSKPEELLIAALRAAGYPAEIGVYVDPTKVNKWQFDAAFPVVPGRPGFKLAIELNGRGAGGFMGRHQTAAGEKDDMTKINWAIENGGWHVLQYPSGSVGIKKRLELIVQQIGRVLSNCPCPDMAVTVLVGD